MYSTLDVDIRPGSGLGIFEIGISLWTLLDRLRSLPHNFPQVEVKYDPDATSTTPIIVHIRPHLDLLFSGKGQRLHTICVRKLRDPNPPVTLRYNNTVISSVNDVLRRVVVSRTFGPTYPGDELRYPGLWFSFDDDTIGDAGPIQPAAAPAAVDKTQEVKRVFISQPGNDGKGEDALDEVKELPSMAGEIRRAILKVHDGIALHFYGEGFEPLHIRIGQTTAQDLSLDLGPPLRIHYKDDERMTIHRATSPEGVEEGAYFYNYFQHGLDFLICGNTHIVKKIIVHTNLPGSPLFQRYKRCCWELEGPPEDDEDDSPPRKPFYERFETISHFLSPREPPGLPMQLDRTDEDDALTLQSPATRLYGYDGITLEVTESSQVVSVVLF
ncbi:hypothetical protein CC1G_00388 [Coprinopsis cinerea okayama7|uniref:Uncharacterized protein n=1 Tax=Coprinopsis cinerea (strain Okayama-7 / 130 / ATCC MYA-4618 / FGSC 9003) TaxID=240176 RepID=A8NXS3_COPC7|nr:hypothetical protein CC1G_00388 [Coprinopsis cinerea okayama7\|eukprot:XP_001837252.1 hypothetical protein CC1G_00388 [Coprinopsis cinerea okayama7\